MASHGKAEEAKLQAQCVVWLWNTYPETRGLFFSVENEGARISASMVKQESLFIQQNLQRPQNILQSCRKLIEMCSNGNAVAGAQAKAMGVTSGVSDCLFMWKGETYCFEFKTETGRQSEKQLWWEGRVTEHGFRYIIVRNYASFVSFLKAVLE